MGRPISQKPYDPSKAVPDRRNTDLLRNAMVAEIDVVDPYGIDPGDKITTLRNLRGDPLAALHARRSINEAQYQAGREFQSDFEIAERGPQAIDPSKEYVDGGRPPEPITEAQQKAVKRLNRAERELGVEGSAIIHDALITGLRIDQIAERRGMVGPRWNDYFGRRVKECLTRLAVIYGFAMEGAK